VEIEISPFSYEENQKAVIATAAELGISVLAYSYVIGFFSNRGLN
jgi:pyridoxine 4-dehydrogenase